MSTQPNRQPTHDVVFIAGSYTDRDGKERKIYRTIGAAWPNKDGQPTRIRLDMQPVSWDGWFFLYERKDDHTKGGAQ